MQEKTTETRSHGDSEEKPNRDGLKPVEKLCVSARPGGAGRAGVTPW